MSFFSRDSAEDLAQKIYAARANNTDFELALVLIENGKEEDAGAYRVREIRKAQRLFGGREMVHGATVAADRKVEILFPPPSERAIGVAEILISDD